MIVKISERDEPLTRALLAADRLVREGDIWTDVERLSAPVKYIIPHDAVASRPWISHIVFV